jgi:hypothetical protein
VVPPLPGRNEIPVGEKFQCINRAHPEPSLPGNRKADLQNRTLQCSAVISENGGEQVLPSLQQAGRTGYLQNIRMNRGTRTN